MDAGETSNITGVCFHGARGDVKIQKRRGRERPGEKSDAHLRGLAGGFHHRAPEVAGGIHLAAAAGDQAHRQVDEALVPAGDDHAGLARHAGVHGVAAEIEAENPVLGRGRNAADDITRIDVFEIELDLLLLEMADDPVLEKQADVGVEFVARGVGGVLRMRE